MWMAFLGDLGYTGTLTERFIAWENGGYIVASFNITFTGLSTDFIGTFGEIGQHASISYTIDPDNGTETVKWSNSPNPADAATYGTGANPTDFAASEGSLVYLHVTDDNGGGPETRTFSFTARFPAVVPTYSSQPVITTPAYANQEILLDVGSVDSGDIVVETLTFNGADILDRLVTTDGADNPITPRVSLIDLFVYGQTNTLAMRTEATNEWGSTLSNTVFETITSVPDQMAAPVVTAVDTTTISVDRAAAPDTGGNAITSYNLRWTTDINFQPTQWTVVEGITDPQSVSGFFPEQQVWVQTQAVNAAGGGLWSAEDDATTDAGVPAVNPAFELLDFVAGGAGTADNLRALGFTYSGADTLDFFGVTTTTATLLSKADIEAGTGTGALEEFSVLDVDVTTLDVILSGLTSTSEAATHIQGFIKERNNGGSSQVRVTTVTGLDFTSPTLSTAATDAGGTITTLTFSENVFGTAVTGNWTLDEDTVPVAISNVEISENTVTLTHAAVSSGTTLTISYSGGNIRDAKSNALATITDAAVTNNVSASPVNTFTAGVELITVEELATLPALTFTAGEQKITVSEA